MYVFFILFEIFIFYLGFRIGKDWILAEPDKEIKKMKEERKEWMRKEYIRDRLHRS